MIERADSAYYQHAFIATALSASACFSVTARQTNTVKTAIAGIKETAWRSIRYPEAIWDEQAQAWISGAEVAEVSFIAFTSRRKPDHVTARLIVRRVKRLGRAGHDELVPAWRHHAVFPNSPFGDARGRGLPP